MAKKTAAKKMPIVKKAEKRVKKTPKVIPSPSSKKAY